MAEVIQKLFLVTVVCLEVTCSDSSTWKRSMKICNIQEKRPSTERDILQNDTWIGKAIFELSGGIITLQIQEVEEYETSSRKSHEFYERSIQLNDNISFSEEILQNLTQGQKYVVRNFDRMSIDGIPSPTQCMVHRGASHTEYVACNNSFAFGCRKFENSSQIKMIISFNPSSGSSSTNLNCINRGLQNITSNGDVSDCSSQIRLKADKYQLLALGGVLSALLIFFDILCIYWCAKYQVKKKLKSRRKEKNKEISCKPIAETITRIYGNVNFEGNSNYDLVSNMNEITSARIFDKEGKSAHYNKGFFRLLTQSGNYDTAWSSTASPPATNDYDLVQKVAMPAAIEEETYSKQRLDPEERLEDIKMPPETSADKEGSHLPKVTPYTILIKSGNTADTYGEICEATDQDLCQDREINISGNCKAVMNTVQQNQERKDCTSESKNVNRQKSYTDKMITPL